MTSTKIGFIGFGRMAKALVSAMLSGGYCSDQIVFFQRDVGKAQESSQRMKLRFLPLHEVISESEVLLLCVKPQQVEPIVAEMTRYKLKGKLLISILAGIPLEFFQSRLSDIALCRAMPNTPLSVGEGMTGLCFGPLLSPHHKAISISIFSAGGKTLEVPESAMNAVTALSGSGPAFLYQWASALTSVATQYGISEVSALTLIAQTMVGAGQMLLARPSPGALIDEVRSPGGTTAAGLDAWGEQHLDTALQHVMLSSLKRAEELAKKGP